MTSNQKRFRRPLAWMLALFCLIVNGALLSSGRVGAEKISSGDYLAAKIDARGSAEAKDETEGSNLDPKGAGAKDKSVEIYAEKNRTFIDVPVPFVSDRNNQQQKDAFKKLSVDQLIGSKHVWLGVAHVALYASEFSAEDLAAAEKWGCKRITWKEAHRPYYTNFDKQLKDSGLNVCIPTLRDDHDCHPFRNKQYSSFENSVSELLHNSESKERLIFRK